MTDIGGGLSPLNNGGNLIGLGNDGNLGVEGAIQGHPIGARQGTIAVQRAG